MKNPLFAVMLLCVGCGALQAQVPIEEWSVFEPGSHQAKLVEVQQAVIASVVADDDRKEITGQAPEWEKAVVVLEMSSAQGTALCSGSMVGPNLVLTAAHCLNYQGEYMQGVNVYAVGMPAAGHTQQPVEPPSAQQPKKDEMDSIIDILTNENQKKNKKKSLESLADQIIRRMHVAQAVEQNGIEDMIKGLRHGGYPSASAKQLWVPSPWIRFTKNKPGGTVDIDKEETYDYGIIVLDKPLGNQTGWLGLAVLSEDALKGAEIVVVGRGGDKPSRSLWEGKGRVGKVHKRYFFHNADQVGGNSGGPIMKANDRSRIVALANFGDGRARVSGGYPNGGLRITNSITSAVQKAAN